MARAAPSGSRRGACGDESSIRGALAPEECHWKSSHNPCLSPALPLRVLEGSQRGPFGQRWPSLRGMILHKPCGMALRELTSGAPRTKLVRRLSYARSPPRLPCLDCKESPLYYCGCRDLAHLLAGAHLHTLEEADTHEQSDFA